VRDERVLQAMTVLGRDDLIRRLATKELVVSPIFSAEQIGAASIDMRMGNVALVVRTRGSSHVDPSVAKAADQTPDSLGRTAGQTLSTHLRARDQHQRHERYDIPFQSRFLLHPGALVLVPTLEWVQLPGYIIGTVTARSTWAREGLSIATATLVEPGYQGIVTLELANLGQVPIALYPGLCIAQMAFALVQGRSKRPGKSQYDLSFEPIPGKIAKASDLPFIPIARQDR
jgi:dCTP deaminase